MHMSDALLSPAVGGTMWAAAGAVMAGCARKLHRQVDSARVPLMGVLAAFVFAGQMVNFAIPGTGSSGHLGGGIILAALLGPAAAFVAMASILTVQALFFADGGLLALGCNIFNLGFFPAFVAYPLLFRPVLGQTPTPGRIAAASVAAAVAGLELGALAVVVQTTASGIAELPFASFAAIVLPIHLAIGIVEGLATAAVVSFVWRARPEVLAWSAEAESVPGVAAKKLIAGLAAAAVITAGFVSWFASPRPDGLEWSVERTAKGRIETPAGGIHDSLGKVQEKTSILPDYGLPAEKSAAGTSLAGLVGGILTLFLTAAAALFLRRRANRQGGGGTGP
jgi:cobalt/nickel transport system permease protein